MEFIELKLNIDLTIKKYLIHFVLVAGGDDDDDDDDSEEAPGPGGFVGDVLGRFSYANFKLKSISNHLIYETFLKKCQHIFAFPRRNFGRWRWWR